MIHQLLLLPELLDIKISCVNSVHREKYNITFKSGKFHLNKKPYVKLLT